MEQASNPHSGSQKRNYRSEFRGNIMQYVYLLKASRKVTGGHLMKIGKTIRSPKKRLTEINRSWADRGIRWRIVRVMSVFNCHAKEAALHREYKRYHVSPHEVSRAWGGVCDGDSEIFILTKADRKKLLHHMGAHSWSFDRTTWIAIGLGLGLLAGVWVWRSSVDGGVEVAIER